MTYTVATNVTLGSKYVKALYVGYTDATFTTKAPQPAERGLLGPLIFGEVRLPFDDGPRMIG